MKLAFLFAALLAVAAPVAAHADDQTLSGGSYLQAAHCLAYADLPALRADTIDVGALRTAVVAAAPRQTRLIRGAASDDVHSVGAQGYTLARSPGGLDQLRQRRDDACASFVQSGLVQLETASPAS